MYEMIREAGESPCYCRFGGTCGWPHYRCTECGEEFCGAYPNSHKKKVKLAYPSASLRDFFNRSANSSWELMHPGGLVYCWEWNCANRYKREVRGRWHVTGGDVLTGRRADLC